MLNIKGRKNMGKKMDLEFCFVLMGSGREIDTKELSRITRDVEREFTIMQVVNGSIIYNLLSYIILSHYLHMLSYP